MVCVSQILGIQLGDTLGRSHFQRHVPSHAFLFSTVTSAAFSKILLCSKQLGLNHLEFWWDLISVGILNSVGSRGGVSDLRGVFGIC